MSRFEEITFDLRSNIEKEIDRFNVNTVTFKEQPDIWKDNPRLIYSEEVKIDRWIPSIYLVSNETQIIYITAEKKMKIKNSNSGGKQLKRNQRVTSPGSTAKKRKPNYVPPAMII